VNLLIFPADTKSDDSIIIYRRLNFCNAGCKSFGGLLSLAGQITSAT
jgi:hypothetical protein